ncbi:MAG TPA: N-acyl homoserine lactonase family protein [Sphingomonas sp.]|nr:N-acyl homoserine lactonase family protein [Sphingomonas sp.]
MTDVNRLFVLLCGYEVLPKTVSTRDRGARFIVAEPVCAYLLDTRAGWVLLDTGINPAYCSDPELREREFLRHGWSPPVVRQDHLLEAQMAEIGVTPDQIRHVILSHLHFDHGDRLDRFSNARISVQRREHLWAFGEAPGPGYIADDYTMPGLDWDLRDGDWDAMPGLSLLDTRGHTPGHQSALVRLPSGKRILLPFDAGDFAENFIDRVLPGQACDDVAAIAAIDRLNLLCAEPDVEMLLFHDPVAIQTIRLAPDCYE